MNRDLFFSMSNDTMKLRIEQAMAYFIMGKKISRYSPQTIIDKNFESDQNQKQHRKLSSNAARSNPLSLIKSDLIFNEFLWERIDFAT